MCERNWFFSITTLEPRLTTMWPKSCTVRKWRHFIQLRIYVKSILVKLTGYTVWKIANFSPTIFCKNSVKLTFSLKSFTVNQFDEKIFKWRILYEITTLWHFLGLSKDENWFHKHTVWYLISEIFPPLEKFSVKLIYSIIL